MPEKDLKNDSEAAQSGGFWKRAKPNSGAVPKNSSVKLAKARVSRMNRLSQSISRVGQAMSREAGETRRKIRSARMSVSDRITGADYKKILEDYLGVFKKITKTLLQAFWQLSARYDIKPLDKFDRDNFKVAFKALKTAASKTILTERSLKATFKVVDEKTGQTNTRPDAYMGPYLVFAQIFVKLPLFLKDLLKSLGSLLQLKSSDLSSADDETRQKMEIKSELIHINGILNEMRETMFENPEVLIDVNSLKRASPNEVAKYIKFLEGFSAEVKKIADGVQNVPMDAINKESKFVTLRNQCR